MRFKKAIKDCFGEMEAGKAFKFYATYGFPLPFIKKIALENDVHINEEDLDAEMEKHKAASCNPRKG